MSIVARAFALLRGGSAPESPVRASKRNRSTAAGKRHMARVAAAGCVLGNRGLHICEHLGPPRTTVHHVAAGTSERSDFATVGLCWGGHQGPGGLHGLQPENFCRVYGVPWGKEEGLLIWANEDLERQRQESK